MGAVQLIQVKETAAEFKRNSCVVRIDKIMNSDQLLEEAASVEAMGQNWVQSRTFRSRSK